MRDGGILKICSLQNLADAGFMPKEALVEETEAFFSYRQIGVTRLYAALGANQRIDLLVRVWVTALKDGWKYVVIDDIQYRIDLAQPVGDAIDLTLIRLEDFFDVAEQAPSAG